MEDDIKAMREEIAKLRERVAVLEAAKPALSLGQMRQQWAPPTFPDQYGATNMGSPFSITG